MPVLIERKSRRFTKRTEYRDMREAIKYTAVAIYDSGEARMWVDAERLAAQLPHGPVVAGDYTFTVKES